MWGRLRDEDPHPPSDHHSFAEHAAIVEAIEERDLAAAATRMRLHLETVQALPHSGRARRAGQAERYPTPQARARGPRSSSGSSRAIASSLRAMKV